MEEGTDGGDSNREYDGITGIGIGEGGKVFKMLQG